MCLVFPLCLYTCFLYVSIIVRMAYWLPLCRYSSSSNIPTPIYLPVLISVFVLISLSYIVCRTYRGVRCLYSYIVYLSLCIHLLQFLILLLFLLLRHYSILTNLPSPSPPCRYHPFSFFSYLSVPGYVPWRILPSNFLYQLPYSPFQSIQTSLKNA